MSIESRVSPKERFFEDFSPGEVFEFGDHTVSADEIIAFACQYDPQPFHTDPEAAVHSSFGGLVASGWMTAVVVTRMVVDHFISPVSSMGSPGLDELRWVRPVRPGDRLRVRLKVLGTRRSRSKPDRGLLKIRHDTFNQHNKVVMSVTSRALIRCRSPCSDTSNTE
jgi:acyl dehydratase